MEKPRYWFKAVKLPCALEQAVLRIRVFERENSKRVPLYRDIDAAEAATATGIEIENGLVIPPEDPLLVALDRIRSHQDEVAVGNALLRCWGAVVRGSNADGRNIDTMDSHPIDQEDVILDQSSPTGDRVMVFEISDGIQTEVDGFLRGLELVEVEEHLLKISDALPCPTHPNGNCPGCRHRYKIETEAQPLPTPQSCTPLSEIEVFGDNDTGRDQRVIREYWSHFGKALVEYFAYIEDWLPELVMASCHASPTISVIPTSTDHLNIMFEAVMADNLPQAPINWILNDGHPEMGVRCRILPTGEPAVFLKTLDLAGSPRLEERLLKNVRRLLGNCRLDELWSAAGLAKESPAIWALLWVPDSATVDPEDGLPDVAAGNQQLWPKVLLSSPIASCAGYQEEAAKAQFDSTRISLENGHTQSKNASSLFNEALDITTAIALVETTGPSEPNVDTISSLSNSQKPLATAKLGDGCDVSAQGGQDWQNDNQGTDEEEEDDLFASSPSPAPAELRPTPQGQETSLDNPVAVDSVDRVSSAIFSPALQPSTNIEATKYDISPRDQENPVNGFEAMITDDDFDFFDVDGQGPVSRNVQQVSQEEYGDLSSVDFGVNMNQVPDYLPAQTTLDTKSVNFGVDGEAPEAIWPDGADGMQVDSAVGDRKISDAVASMDTPRESIQSDDDLWNDDSLPDQTEETYDQADIDMSYSRSERSPAYNVDDVPTIDTQKSLRTESSITTALPTTPKLTPQDAVNAIQSARVETDFRQPMLWTLSASAERLVPVDFEEIQFDSTFLAKGGDSNHSGPFSHGNVGRHMADLYGDGRVKTRTCLVALLQAGERIRRKVGSGLLPFHQESAADEIDICSPQSIGSQETEGSDGSVGAASEITSDERGFDERERESILKLGHYPFSDYSVNLERASINLEEQDRFPLRQKIAEHKDFGADTALFNATFETSPAEWVLRRLAPSPLTASNTSLAAHSLSPLKLSGAFDYYDEDKETDVRVRVGRAGNVMEVSGKALVHWQELALEPICGRQNIQTTIWFQKGIRMSEAKTFLRCVTKTYAGLNYGSHTLAAGGHAIRRFDGDLASHLAAEAPWIPRGGVTYVLLLRNSQETRTSLEALDRLNAASDAIAFPIFLQDLSHPKAFARLSCQIYHLLRHNSPQGGLRDGLAGRSKFRHHTFTMAAVPENNKVSFALRWPAPVLDVIESERTLHLAYAFNPATKSAITWLMDDCGQAWRKHEWQYQNVDLAVQDVWAFAMVFIGMANVHWRLVIAKHGELTHSETQAWHAVFLQESQSASGAFAAELVACRARQADQSMIGLQNERIKLFSHRQILSLGAAAPLWVSPLCSATIDHSPSSSGTPPPSLDIHLLLRMSTEAVAFLRPNTEILVRIAHQFAALRALGIHRWFFDNNTPWPAHLHAVQSEQPGATYGSIA